MTASGSRVEVRYVAEVTRGVTPGTPSMIVFRVNAPSLNAARPEIRSEELSADRMTTSLILGQRSGTGSIPSELQLTNHDDWIEAALGGTWDNSPTNSSNISIANPDQVERAAGSFITDGFRAGDIVALSGLAASGENGNYLVSAVAAAAITLKTLAGAAPNLTIEAAGAGPGIDIVGNRVSVGTTLATFTVEIAYTDITQYESFEGVAINTMTLSAQPDAIPTLTYDVLAMDFNALTGTPLDASPTAAPTNGAMSPFGGVIFEGGSVIAYCTGLEVAVANNRELIEVIGSDRSPDVAEGDSRVTGTATFTFPDATLFNKFLNETESSLWFRLVDPSDTTQFIQVVVPRVKYTNPDKTIARTGPITVSLGFEGLKHSVTGTTISFQRSNA